MSIQFSIALQTDKPLAEYAELAARVEELGFDGLSVFADLGFQPPTPALLSAAGATERIRIGAAAMNPSLWHPVDIAGQLACLADAAPDRAYLGLTRGTWLSQIGIGGANAAQVAQTFDIVKLLLSGDESGYAGPDFQIAPGFRLRYPLPARMPGLLLGTWGPRGAALAARHADEVKLGGCANPDMVSVMAGWLAAECDRQGGGRSVGVVAGAVTVVDRDREAARELARTEVAMYLDVVAKLDRTLTVPAPLLTRLRELLAAGDDRAAGRLIDDDLLDRFCFAGTPQDVVEHAVALATAGATRIEFGTPQGLTGRGGIDLLGTEVIPEVRRRLAASVPVA